MKAIYFKSLDAFRGMAILWIVFFHLLDNHPKYGHFIYSIIQSGHLGVQVFFMISGFGVSAAAARILANQGSAAGFLIKRLKRIYGPYLISLIFAALIIPAVSTLLSLAKGHRQDYFFHYSAWEWLQIATLTKVLTAKDWILNKVFDPVNGAVWYVAILVQMYGVTTLVILSKKFYPVIALVTGLCLAAQLPLFYQYVPRGTFVPYWPSYALGVLLYYLISRGRVYRAGLPALLGYLAVGCFLMRSSHSSLLFSLLIFGLFWLLYPWDNQFSQTRLFKIMAFLGMFSYSLYLMHVPLEPLVLMFTRNFVPVSYYVSDLLVEIPAIIALSYFWYLGFERQKVKKPAGNAGDAGTAPG